MIAGNIVCDSAIRYCNNAILTHVDAATLTVGSAVAHYRGVVQSECAAKDAGSTSIRVDGGVGQDRRIGNGHRAAIEHADAASTRPHTDHRVRVDHRIADRSGPAQERTDAAADIGSAIVEYFRIDDIDQTVVLDRNAAPDIRVVVTADDNIDHIERAC